MAEYNENLIKFGWLTSEEMHQAIADGNLDAFDICFTKDTHEINLISSDLTPVALKSKVRIYGSVESAILDINSTSQTYAGEILSIRDDEKFIAYVVNQFADGGYYVSPIYSDTQIDYNKILNIPIINVEGKVGEPINILDLDDGYYKVSGRFITPKGNEINSITGNFFVIESVNITDKIIKRISSDTVIDYYISGDVITYKKYATEEYVQEQGYATEESVDAKITILKQSMTDYIKEYVATTCTLLIKELINQELDHRYADTSDITDLFK